jgi:hypothetical protein
LTSFAIGDKVPVLEEFLMYKLIPLDGRYNGNEFFKYVIQPPVRNKTLNVVQYRNWLWQTFGPSCTLDEYQILVANNPDFEINPRWCWNIRETNTGRDVKFYIKGDEELAWFKLKWEK